MDVQKGQEVVAWAQEVERKARALSVKLRSRFANRVFWLVAGLLDKLVIPAQRLMSSYRTSPSGLKRSVGRMAARLILLLSKRLIAAEHAALRYSSGGETDKTPL